MGSTKDPSNHMEELEEGPPAIRVSRASVLTKLAFGLAVSLLLKWLSSVYFRPDRDGYPKPSRDIDEPFGTLKWIQCQGYDNVHPRARCGYIVAPRDYFNTSAGVATIALSYLRSPSPNPKGVIFYNAGGPGIPAKSFIAQSGDYLYEYLGENYDLVGFDPRGIGESWPLTQCFNGRSTFRSFKRNSVLERGYELAHNHTLEEIRKELIVQQREADSLYKTQFELCRKTVGDDLKYMGTSTVVRDIDFMAKVLTGNDTPINYYSGSYGSVLGQYLVNMLPTRLGRVMIDGIADAVYWTERPPHQWYRQWLSSTENTYDWFVRTCSDIGPEVCPLAKYTGENPEEIKSRVDTFINDLYYAPLSVPNPENPGVLTYGRAKTFLFTALQTPRTWPEVSRDIANAMNGDGSAMLNRAQLMSEFYLDLERSGVSCNDISPFSAPPSAEEVIDELLYVYKNVSRFAFPVVTTEPDTGCQFWPVTPPERFHGPWNHTLSYPMLVLSNTDDPVTPIVAAQKVQDLLGDSARLVLQSAPGVPYNNFFPSLCIRSHSRAYFNDGTLPPVGTICKSDFPPFSRPPTTFSQGTGWTEEELRRLSRLAKMSEALQRVRFGIGYD